MVRDRMRWFVLLLRNVEDKHIVRHWIIFMDISWFPSLYSSWCILLWSQRGILYSKSWAPGIPHPFLQTTRPRSQENSYIPILKWFPSNFLGFYMTFHGSQVIFQDVPWFQGGFSKHFLRWFSKIFTCPEDSRTVVALDLAAVARAPGRCMRELQRAVDLQVLVGGWATLLKNMSSSGGMIRNPVYGEKIE